MRLPEMPPEVRLPGPETSEAAAVDAAAAAESETKDVKEANRVEANSSASETNLRSQQVTIVNQLEGEEGEEGKELTG